MIHKTTNQFGELFYCGMIKNIYIPYNKDKNYIIRRLRYFSQKLKTSEYNVKTDTFNLF